MTASSTLLGSAASPARLGAALLVLSLAACGPQYDPLTREGLWEPSHINRTNLTMQVANPTDLVRGTGTTTSDGQLAAAAVDRLRNDKIKHLPDSDLAKISTGGSGSNESGGQ